MSKEHIYELDYIRAIAMLGVLGIHTGAFAIENPNVNVHFFSLVDILTRFSVPIFFFISAFGLFINYNFSKPFCYAEFYKRRIHTVIVPYLAWSFIYIAHQYWVDPTMPPLTLSGLGNMLFFGYGGYHLYFLVILSWFYLLMPVWRGMLQIIIKKPVLYLTLFYILQNLFNYYSTAVIKANTGIAWLDILISYRLNYWVLHYLFIFLLGGVCGMLYPRFKAFLINRQLPIFCLGIIGTLAMQAYYYYLIYSLGFNCEAAVSTLNQLHPLGIFYTLTTTLFLFALFRNLDANYHTHPLLTTLRSLGEQSYVIYLVHPLFMYYIGAWLKAHYSIITVPVDLFFITATGIVSYFFALCINRAATYASVLNLFIGLPFRPFTKQHQHKISA